jgi:hypothetical protein
MPDEWGAKDPGDLWRNQPEEKLAVNVQQLVNRRTLELYSSTRSEILMSAGAALFFVAVMAWRFASVQHWLPRLGFGVAVAWVLLTLYRFRDRIWRRDTPRADAAAATGLEYYRAELERRRDHLRNAWFWHGPLLLACLVVVLTFAGAAFPGFERLQSVLPLALLLAAWTVAGITRRRRRAMEIQRELDAIDATAGPAL